MASGNKVECPVCGAASKTDGFGREAFRVLGRSGMALSTDPGVSRRRERAALLRENNARAAA